MFRRSKSRTFGSTFSEIKHMATRPFMRKQPSRARMLADRASETVKSQPWISLGALAIILATLVFSVGRRYMTHAS